MAKITQYNRNYHDFLVGMKAHMNAQADILERRAQRLDADDRPASADEARQQAHYCRLYAQRTQDDIDELLSWKDEEGEQS